MALDTYIHEGGIDHCFICDIIFFITFICTCGSEANFTHQFIFIQIGFDNLVSGTEYYIHETGTGRYFICDFFIYIALINSCGTEFIFTHERIFWYLCKWHCAFASTTKAPIGLIARSQLLTFIYYFLVVNSLHIS